MVSGDTNHIAMPITGIIFAGHRHYEGVKEPGEYVYYHMGIQLQGRSLKAMCITPRKVAGWICISLV